jgi:hypothetical protein
MGMQPKERQVQLHACTSYIHMHLQFLIFLLSFLSDVTSLVVSIL